MDERVEHADDDAPMSLRAKVVTAVVLVLALAVIAAVYTHVAYPVVASGDAAPKGHAQLPCWACHRVSG